MIGKFFKGIVSAINEGRDAHDFTKMIKAQAEGGDAQAQVALAHLLAERNAPGDMAASMMWMEKAAEQGNMQAQKQLAELFMRVGKTELAIKWFEQAAAQGDTDAEDRLDELR
jgi:TPR repeat protein